MTNTTNEELVIRIKAHIDVADNMLQLWNQTKRFICLLAKRYEGRAELEDLEQEGYLALYDAIDGYDPGKGVKFLTYAEYWIKQRMTRYTQSNTAVHILAHEWQKIREYQKTVNAFRVYLGRKPTRREIANNIGLSYEEVAKLEKSIKMGQMGSLDAQLSEDGEGTLADMVPADVDVEGEVLDEMEVEELRERLWLLVDSLPDSQAEIIRGKYQKNMTLEQVGETLGIHRGRVRRLEEKALRELRYSDRVCGLYSFLPDAVGSRAYRGSVGQFDRTWTSSTERVALMISE